MVHEDIRDERGHERRGRAGQDSRPLLANVLLLVSVRRPDLRPGGSLFAVALVLRLAGAALLGWIGWVHWVLWQQEGYKFISDQRPVLPGRRDRGRACSPWRCSPGHGR